jgi:hypothetical protein
MVTFLQEARMAYEAGLPTQNQSAFNGQQVHGISSSSSSSSGSSRKSLTEGTISLAVRDGRQGVLGGGDAGGLVEKGMMRGS